MLGYRVIKKEHFSQLISNKRNVPTYAEHHKWEFNTFRKSSGQKCFWFFQNIDDARAYFNNFGRYGESVVVEFSFDEEEIHEIATGRYGFVSVDEFTTTHIFPCNITGNVWECVKKGFGYDYENVLEKWDATLHA